MRSPGWWVLVLGGAARWGRFEKNLAQGEGRGARTVEGLHSASVTSILAKLESRGCPRDSKSIKDSTLLRASGHRGAVGVQAADSAGLTPHSGFLRFMQGPVLFRPEATQVPELRQFPVSTSAAWRRHGDPSPPLLPCDTDNEDTPPADLPAANGIPALWPRCPGVLFCSAVPTRLLDLGQGNKTNHLITAPIAARAPAACTRSSSDLLEPPTTPPPASSLTRS